MQIFFLLQTAKPPCKANIKVWYKVPISVCFFFFNRTKDPLNLYLLGTWVSFLLQLAPNSYTWTASQRGRPRPPGTLKDKLMIAVMWLKECLADYTTRCNSTASLCSWNDIWKYMISFWNNNESLLNTMKQKYVFAKQSSVYGLSEWSTLSPQQSNTEKWEGCIKSCAQSHWHCPSCWGWGHFLFHPSSLKAVLTSWFL